MGVGSGPRIEEAVIVARAQESAVEEASVERRSTPAALAGNWLIVAPSIHEASTTEDPRARLADDLSRRLKEMGAGCQQIDEGMSPSDFQSAVTSVDQSTTSVDQSTTSVDQSTTARRALANEPLKGILHLGGLRSALAVVQTAVQASGNGDAPQLWLITIGAQPASGLCDPWQAGLWGFGKVVALEHPELRCVRVDLDPADPQPAQTLLNEIVLQADLALQAD